MNRIEEDIAAGRFSGVYLLYGEDGYLRSFWRNRLLKALVPPDDTINFAKFQGKDLPVQELVSLAGTMPFFAQHRVILAEDSSLFGAGHGADSLVDAMGSFPDSTVLIFSEEKPEKTSRLYKAVQKKGVLLELKHPDERMLTDWVLRRLGREGMQIQRSAMNWFLENTSTDMRDVSNELEKVICYCMGREAVTLEDVKAVIPQKPENRIFDLVDAMAAQNRARAMKLCRDLLSLREKPLGIVFRLGSHFNTLLLVQDLRAQGYDQNAICEKLGMKPYPARKALQQSAKLSQGQLRRAVERCVRADEDVKSGRLEERMALEVLLAEALK